MGHRPVNPEQSGDVASAASINARLDRLPATRYLWTLVFLLSLGGWFEFYDLFFTAYVAPGLVKSGIFTTTTSSFFGLTGLSAFIAATFAGLFLGTFGLASFADRFGRRMIFTASLLWYTVATAIMAFQTTAGSLNLWRLIAGIGIGVELVTIDTYITELVPSHQRGRAFAFNHTVQYTAVPVMALLAYLLVPRAPFGLDGWRWVILIGASGAVLAWFVRLAVPESPRWLALHGHLEQAEAVTARMEAKVAEQSGQPLPQPDLSAPPIPLERARFAEIWKPEFRGRTAMLMVFNFFQTIGFYGFASWVPTLLVARGITITHSLLYSFVIAIASPIGPLLAIPMADTVERKWVIVCSALGIAIFGIGFSQATSGPVLIAFGVLITLSNTILSAGFHAYQPELFPTRIRARAVGFVYSVSRLSAMFSGFLIAFWLRHFGTSGVFIFIGGCMGIVAVTIGYFGPRTRGLQLEAISR